MCAQLPGALRELALVMDLVATRGEVVIVVGLEKRAHSISSHLLPDDVTTDFSIKERVVSSNEGKLLPLVRKTLVDLGFDDGPFHSIQPDVLSPHFRSSFPNYCLET